MRRRVRAGTAAIAALAMAGSAGCGTALVGTAAAAEITTVGSCDALLDRLHEIGRAHVGPYGLDGTGVVTEDIVEMPRPTMASPRLDADAAPGNGSAPTQARATPAPEAAASGTNVQEAGVDEDDTVKAGPGRVLVLGDGDDVLRYVDVTATTPRLRGSVRFGFDTEGMLVEGDRVVVIGAETGSSDGPERPEVILAEVDVTDPDHPVRGGQVRIDGDLSAARSHDGTARIVVDSTPAIGFVAPGWGTGMDDAATAANRRIVDATVVEDWLPQVDGQPGVDCAKVMIPRDYAGIGMLAVYTLDMTAPLRIADSTALMAHGEIAYAGESTLYVAMGGSDATWAGTEAAPTPATRIHAFDVSGTAAASYTASGQVAGSLKDRWAMSDAGGVLRVVTTTTGADGREVTGLTTMERKGGDLTVVGHVGGLGRGEQVKAVRFTGDVAYVVTFKRTDPLWVLDLHDPAAPVVAGELHMPGYSTYLHPIDGGRLIGVGQDADPATGRPLGMQVALYDVTDPARPAVAAKWQAPPGTTSLAEMDPHAFLWWSPTGTLALPVTSGTPTPRPLPAVPPRSGPATTEQGPTSRDETPTGATTLVLHADAAGLTETGRIACPPPAPSEDRVAWDAPRRNVVVGTAMYTICGFGMAAHNLDGLAPAGEVHWN